MSKLENTRIPGKIETLNDINNKDRTNKICSCGSTKESHGLNWIREEAIHELVIKWVKEDIKVVESGIVLSGDYFIQKWMKRLNVEEEDLKIIDKRRKYHQKQFDRYNKECIQARSDKDKSQLEYSENQAIKEMNINDELKELKEKIEEGLK